MNLYKGLKINHVTLNYKLKKNGRPHWNVTCVCGKSIDVRQDRLKSKTRQTKSCGCKRSYGHRTTHNLSKHRLYAIYGGMKQRCHNPLNDDYKYYGGRGIEVCDEWKDDFLNFYNWALENGYKYSLTIDRIENDGDYSPENCQWVSRKFQSRNQSTNNVIEIDGESKCLAEWCEVIGISIATVKWRVYNKKWSYKKALTEPIRRSS